VSAIKNMGIYALKMDFSLVGPTNLHSW